MKAMRDFCCRLAAWNLNKAVVAILTTVMVNACTGTTVYSPITSYPSPLMVGGGVELYGTFPGPYASAYLHQPIYLTNPGFLSTPIIYNYYFPAFVAQAPTLTSPNRSTSVQGAASIDGPDEADEGTSAFKFAFGRVKAKAELIGQLTVNGIQNTRGYAYFSTDAAVKGTTVLGVLSTPAFISNSRVLFKIGTSNNCQNAIPTEIYNPTSVTGGGRIYTLNAVIGQRNLFYIDRSVPEDVISLTGSRSIIGRTVLVTPSSATVPDGGGSGVIACGVIVPE